MLTECSVCSIKCLKLLQEIVTCLSRIERFSHIVCAPKCGDVRTDVN